MKAKEVRRLAQALQSREQRLFERFLDPVWTIASWSGQSRDYAASYCALLHAEIEYSLEEMVRRTLRYTRVSSERWQSHPLLVNAVLYFQTELSNRLAPIQLCPKRDVLELDAVQLVNAWETFGVKAFYEHRLATNYGAGVDYIEELLHPLGIVVSDNTFEKRLKSRGIKALGQLRADTQTELTEFVVLRGSAVHAGTAAFAQRVQNETPSQIRARGQAAVKFADAIASVLQSSAW